ncbi:unnamed protein product [Larinioides sclopetarius]|uniref:Ribosomal protein L16 n=1 Tax=Larinioides sclopetarius TaxID=280406 RepID=A0AAV2B056_9ARAC
MKGPMCVKYVRKVFLELILLKNIC